MTKVLLIEKLDDKYETIERLLQECSRDQYLVNRAKSVDPEYLLETSFDAILVGQNQSNSCVSTLKSLLQLNLAPPVIFISTIYDDRIDKKVFELGVDDSLALDELTSRSLNRAIQHAIQRKSAESKLAFLSTHDQLTGLANRYLLHQHLEHATSMAKRTNSPFAILFLDLDKFKLINDSLGHEIGDLLLIQVAERLTTSIRETDIVSRFGNDEFVILLENFGPNCNLTTIAEKIQKSMEPVFNVRQHELFITTSIGIATFPECGIEPESLLKSADSALYKAKETGRNQFHFFTGDLNKQARVKLELEKNLRRALINGEFEIFLQPQITPQDGHVAGAEALLRWNHPTQGMVSPGLFIPMLEDLGLLAGVEGWVLNQVCTLAKSLTDKFGKMRFSVNISGAHFKTGNLKENIFLALQSSSLDANYLEVELTENIMIEHVERNNILLSELKELGISIALDDFGKGYSSLSYLKNFPADILKIDKAFIDHLVEDKRDSAIVESLVALSHKLGIKVVAEGVERSKQLSHLKTIGCDYIQGYYFAKPMPISNFEQFVSHNINAKVVNSNH